MQVQSFRDRREAETAWLALNPEGHYVVWCWPWLDVGGGHYVIDDHYLLIKYPLGSVELYFGAYSPLRATRSGCFVDIDYRTKDLASPLILARALTVLYEILSED